MQQRQIKCPQCGRLTVYSTENSARPFCSERCKLIDLGAWADESYKVPAPKNQENSIQELSSDEFNIDSDSEPDAENTAFINSEDE